MPVEDLAARAQVGETVVVRGQLVLGGVWCQCRTCVAVVALGTGVPGDVQSAEGPLALLEHPRFVSQGRVFQDFIMPGPARSCRWTPEGRYCCPSESMGKDVIVRGRTFPPPVVRTGKAYTQDCTAEESVSMSYHAVYLPREFTVPWREKLEAISALAVDDACRVVD